MSRFRTLENVLAVGSAMLVSISAAGAAQAQAAPAAPAAPTARVAPAAPAASAASGDARLTLEEALRHAEETSPLVRRARVERDAIAARDVGASLLLPANPVIAGGVGPRREGPPSSVVDERGLQYFVHAEQAVEIGGQRSARRAVVSRALHTAELRVTVARAETRARVRAAYVGTQLALARVEAA